MDVLLLSLCHFHDALHRLALRCCELFPETIEIYVTTVQIIRLVDTAQQQSARAGDYHPLLEDLYDKLSRVEAAMEDAAHSHTQAAWRAKHGSRYRRYFAVACEELRVVTSTLAETVGVRVPPEDYASIEREVDQYRAEQQQQQRSLEVRGCAVSVVVVVVVVGAQDVCMCVVCA